ncbi:MAG: metalloregulator ArsR/SmtB family transcription factor [Candidatus Pacebacteria bacterium]|nr:metalloregulator ArsR/SmtB family transcription factor [Candidatus Paceibacterota bacterium]
MHLNELAGVLKTTGDENRLKILCTIFDAKKVCVSDIASTLHLSVAIVSHHLQTLSQQGLVTPVREGKNVCYELQKTPFVADLKKFVCKYR